MSSSNISEKIVFCDQFTIGPHVSYLKTLDKTILNAISEAYYSIQIMLGSPYSYSRSKVTDKDLKTSIKLLSICPINVYIHSPYVYNLAGSQKLKTLAWTGNSEVDNKVEQCILGLEHELKIISALKNENNQTGVVLHIGAWSTGKNDNETKEGLDAVIESINKIRFPKNSTLFLETMVGKGGVLGKTFEQLKYILDNVEQSQVVHLKICVDTCHVFANGQYDFKTKENIDKLFEDFKKCFGTLELLGLFHFNDSCDPHSSCVDHHARIGQGFIWKDKEVLKYFISLLNKHNIPAILETEPSDYNVIQTI